ncbi:MAG: PAS domain-containing protein, partial [Planctomycetota bacterium]
VALKGLHVLSLETLGEDLWVSTLATTGGQSGIARLHNGKWQTFHSAAGSALGHDGSSKVYFSQSGRILVVGEPDIVDTRSITLPTRRSSTRVVPGWDGDSWVGTSGGVLHYRPDGVPPETIAVPEQGEVVHGEQVRINVRGVERNRPTSDGRTWLIAMSIDGEPWGGFVPLSNNGVIIRNMAPGVHEIALRVMDEGGDVDPEPSHITLRVRPIPIQERVWFLPLVAALAAGMLCLATLSLAGWRKVKAQAEGLELEVERRNLELLERQAQVDLAIAGSRGGSWIVHLDPSDPLHPPLSAHYSESSWEILGLDPQSLPGTSEDWLDRVLPEDSATISAAVQRLFSGETDSYEVEYRARHADGGVRWLLSRGRIERDDQGRPMMLVGIHWDVTERRLAEEAMRESEERFRLLAEHVPGVIYLSLNDERWTMIYLNDEIEPLTGYSKGDFLEGRVSLAELCHPDDLPSVRRQVAEAVAEHRSFHNTYRLKHSSGQWRWVEEFGVGVFKEGELRHVEGFLFDVTDRVLEEERRELMMRELDHRVKNMLATVMAVADRTLHGSADLPEFAAAFRGRIASLAQVHEALTHSKWQGASLRDLVQRALAPYRGEDFDRISIEGRDLTLSIHAAPPLAMALHELATNAVKYGSLSVPTGRLDIVFEVSPAAERHRVRLCWMESGGPPVVQPKERGFGLTLIEQGVEYQLGGQVKLDLHPTGLCCEIVFTA